MTANDNTIRLPATAKPSASPSADTGELYHKTGTKAVYWLDEDGTDYDLTAGAAGAIVTSGSGNPASAPASIGDIYIDTTNDRVFIAADNSAATDYKIVGGNSRAHYDLVADYTANVTTLTAVDATNLNLSITTNGGDVEIYFAGGFSASGANNVVSMDVYETSTTSYLGGNAGVVFEGLPNLTGVADYESMGFFVRWTGLVAGTYTFQLHWMMNSANNVTLHGGSGTGVLKINPQFGVREV